MHSIVVDPANAQRLYIGTDLGVYVSVDGGGSWSVENTGFANVVTERLRVNTTAAGSSLFAFTHGRGAFKVALSGAPANDAFADAQVLLGSSGSVSGSNVGASKETLEPNIKDNAGGASVWYSWTAPSAGTLTVDTQGSATGADTLLAVYTGSTVRTATLPGPEWENDDENHPTVLTSKVGSGADLKRGG